MLGDVLRQMFRPRYSFVSSPAQDVTQGRKTGTWIATGPQPRLSLQPANGKWPRGWVLFRTRLVRRTTDYTATLICETGDGIEDRQVICIPVPLKGTVNEVIYLPAGITALQWSPIGGLGSWDQAPLVMVEVSAIERIARMTWRVYRMMKRLQRENRKDAQLSYARLVCALQSAYSAAGRLRHYVPKHRHGRWIERSTHRGTVTLRIYGDAIISTLQEVSRALMEMEQESGVDRTGDVSLLRRHFLPSAIGHYRTNYHCSIIQNV